MKLWNALIHPVKDGTFRRVWSAFAVAAIGWFTYLSLTSGEDWWQWLIGLWAMLLLLVIWLNVWAAQDARDRARMRENREAPIITNTAVSFLHPPTEAIPVTRPEDAADPFAYAMMKALETDEPVSVYRDDDGVWRDSITDAVLPVQESDESKGQTNG